MNEASSEALTYMAALKAQRQDATVRDIMGQLGLIIQPPNWLAGFRTVLNASTSRFAYSLTVLA